MTVIDANLLLYAYDLTSAFHPQARAWLEAQYSSPALIGLPLQSVSAFLRILTHPRLPGTRLLPAQAVAIVDTWLALPQVQLLDGGRHHWPHFRSTLIDGQARGALVTDAHLAALTIQHGGTLHTTDRDFARFPGLRWKNPL